MLAALFLAVMLTITAFGAQVGAAVVARHRAQAAADLAALAAAGVLPGGPGAACGRAQVVLATMGLPPSIDCQVQGLDVVVTVDVGRARAAARAGPVTS